MASTEDANDADNGSRSEETPADSSNLKNDEPVLGRLVRQNAEWWPDYESMLRRFNVKPIDASSSSAASSAASSSGLGNAGLKRNSPNDEISEEQCKRSRISPSSSSSSS
eukprot:gene9451-10440_t